MPTGKPGADVIGLCIIGDWAFEAHNTGKNQHHRSQVMVGRERLNDWTIAVRYKKAV